MSDQVDNLRSGAGRMRRPSVIAPASPGNHEPFHGRPVSLVAVSIIMLGFLVGGLPSSSYRLVAVLDRRGPRRGGGSLALSTDIFEDWY